MAGSILVATLSLSPTFSKTKLKHLPQLIHTLTHTKQNMLSNQAIVYQSLQKSTAQPLMQ